MTQTPRTKWTTTAAHGNLGSLEIPYKRTRARQVTQSGLGRRTARFFHSWGSLPVVLIAGLMLVALMGTAGCGAVSDQPPSDYPSPGEDCPNGICGPGDLSGSDYDAYRVVATRLDASSPAAWTFRVAGDETTGTSDLLFIWDFGTGDGRIFQGASQSFTFPTVGTYLVTVTAVTPDNQIAFVLALEIEIPPLPNLSPLALGGDNRMVVEGRMVCLDGSASSDPNDDPLEFSWRQLTGDPLELEVDPDDPAIVCFTAPEVDGEEVILMALSVSDGEYTVEDIVEITIRDAGADDIGLVADAGPDITVNQGEPVRLDGRGSSGQDGIALQYVWSQVEGPSVDLNANNLSTANFIAPFGPAVPFTLGFNLIVIQGSVTAQDQVRVTVLPNDNGDAAEYFEDFSAYGEGDNPNGWFDTGANNSALASDNLFSIMRAAGETVFGTRSTLTNIHSHYRGSGADTWHAYTYSGKMYLTDSSGGIGVTFLSGYPNSDSYYRLRRGQFAGGETFHIAPHGTTITDGDWDTGVNPEANRWYNFLIDVADDGVQTNIRAKVWEAGSSEPADWQVDCADASGNRRTSGTIGLWAMSRGEKYWDDLEVTGSGGASCDVDSDDDGVPDCEDLCPGAPDVDSDNDLWVDCLDQCPTDPAKIDPGDCGCGVADEDLNGDGVSDCAETPRICVSPTSLDFGTTSTSLSFEVWNCGSDELDYEITDNVGWLQTSPTTGSSSGDRDTIIATVDRSGLSPASYSGRINVTSEGNLATINVSLLVQEDGEVDPPPPPSTSPLTPIARWDVVPYQRIGQGETFKCGVIAFSRNGIDRVRFTVNGSTRDVTSMTYNDRVGVYEYWTPISASQFSSAGPITVGAVITGQNGGTIDLGTIKLVVDPDGSLPQPETWVDASSGNDQTGTVGNSGRPYRTIGKAIVGIRDWMRSNGYGSRADGGIVRLKPGTHSMDNGGFYDAISTSDEWVTITTAAGGTRSNTLIVDRNSLMPSVKLFCCRGITVKSGGQYRYVFLGGSDVSDPYLWLDDCDIIGSGRWVAGSNPIPQTWDKKWLTSSYITNVDFAVGVGQMARGLTIEGIGNDAFQHCPMVVDCSANDLDPGSTGWHSDAWQWYSTGGPSNTIVYNYRCTDAHYQGIMCRTGVSSSSAARNVAFVNMYVELRAPHRKSNGPASLWMRSVDHLLLWNCTFVGHPFNIYDDQQNGQSFGTVLNNLDVQGCVFDMLKVSAPKGSVPSSAFAHNHYVSNSDYNAVMLGSDISSGNAGLDSSGTPQSGSPLLNRITPPMVPCDADNSPRGSTGDVGAYER